jgi:tetratricopeptide (TPR) repeat protein
MFPVSPRLNVFHALTPGKRFNRKICLAAPAAGQERSRIVAEGGDAWSVDPLTLREIVLDPHRMRARLVSCIDLERVWILTLLGEYEEAVATGEALLSHSVNRFGPLLILARAYRGQYRWSDAARLQEEALRLARTTAREATVRHQIGQRLFDEARYRDAAAEFEWARDLFRSSRRPEAQIRASAQAMARARNLAGGIPKSLPASG